MEVEHVKQELLKSKGGDILLQKLSMALMEYLTFMFICDCIFYYR